jgi:hypothetical protein
MSESVVDVQRVGNKVRIVTVRYPTWLGKLFGRKATDYWYEGSGTVWYQVHPVFKKCSTWTDSWLTTVAERDLCKSYY